MTNAETVIRAKFSLAEAVCQSLSQTSVLLFDTSIWNRLADGKSREAVDVRDSVLSLRVQNRLFCPLCEPVLWELRKQEGASLGRTAELMEALSCNVTFRSLEQVFDAEVRHFVRYLLTGTFAPLMFSERFGPLLSYLSPGFSLIWPDHEAREESADALDGLSATLNDFSVTKLISYFGRMPQVSTTVPDRQAVATRRRKLSHGTIARARRIETEYLARTHFLPRIECIANGLHQDEREELRLKLDQLPKTRRYNSAVEHILKFAPAMAAWVEAETLGGLDVTRANHENDFQDLTLCIYGLSYSHVFAAVDGWIESLVAMARREDFPAFIRFAGSLEQLAAALESIPAASARG